MDDGIIIIFAWKYNRRYYFLHINSNNFYDIVWNQKLQKPKTDLGFKKTKEYAMNTREFIEFIKNI